MGHPDVDAMHLRKTCERSDLIRVETEEGGDWSALLKGVDEKFVDVYSPADTYMPEFWGRLAQLFDQLKEALPGGRYSCAKALVALRLPFLAEFSLGKMCHVVQVAISQKKLLGYHNGTLVPYRLSRDMMKEQCALRQRPCGTNVSHVPSTAPLASLESVCTGLRTLLEASSGSLPLSNVKRLFRSRFRLELSETALGYSKLCELLQDPYFSDVCTVRLEGNGYTVFQVSTKYRKTVCLADTLSHNTVRSIGNDSNADDSPSRFQWPMLELEDVYHSVMVQNTFLHTRPTSGQYPRTRRSRTLPRNLGSSKNMLDSSCDGNGCDQFFKFRHQSMDLGLESRSTTSEPATDRSDDDASTETDDPFGAIGPLDLDGWETTTHKKLAWPSLAPSSPAVPVVQGIMPPTPSPVRCSSLLCRSCMRTICQCSSTKASLSLASLV